MEKELLQQFRDQVKTIDLEIIYLLSRRFENVKQNKMCYVFLI